MINVIMCIKCPILMVRHMIVSIFYAITSIVVKFALVLLLAYFIALGIFELWETIIPDGEETRRLSAAAVEHVNANPPTESPKSKVQIQGENEQNDPKNDPNYPFIVEIPIKDMEEMMSAVQDIDEAAVETVVNETKLAVKQLEKAMDDINDTAEQLDEEANKKD